MNLQTVLRRYYPIYVSECIRRSHDFTLLVIPVTPSFAPPASAMSIATSATRRFDVNVLSWFSRLYTYWRGSMRYKVIVSAKNSDVYVWHNPNDARGFSYTSGYAHEHVCAMMNFATVGLATQTQQGVEIETPFFSSYNQLLHAHVKMEDDLRSQCGTLYIAIRNTEMPVGVSVFASTGEDFFFNVLRAPPRVHETFAMPFSDGGTPIAIPEFQRPLHAKSEPYQIPGGQAFETYRGGYFGDFIPPDFIEGEEQMMRVLGLETGMQDIRDSIKRFEDKMIPLADNINSLTSEVRDHTLPQVLGHAKLLHSDMSDIVSTAQDYLPLITETLDHINGTAVSTGLAANAHQQFGESAAGTFHEIRWLLKSINIATLWINLVSLIQEFSFAKVLSIIVLGCGVFSVDVSYIYQFIVTNLTSAYDGFRPNATDGAMSEQSLSTMIMENQEQVNVALAAIATVIYCALFGVLPSWSKIQNCIKLTISKGEEQAGDFSEFLKSVHFNNLGFKAIMNAYDFFREWIERIVDWFLGQECKNIKVERAFKERSDEVIKWLEELAELDDIDIQHLALAEVDVHNRYYRLMDQGLEFQKWMIREKVPANMTIVIRDAMRRLTDMIKQLQLIQPGHGFRYAPFVVLLNGNTGTGKSNMMHQLRDQCIEDLAVPYYNSHYSVPAKDKYLSRYEGQAIVEWDDHLQNREQDEMAAEFINWCSNADAPLNMADLDHKGMLFTSKAIIMTSNCGFIRINAIRDMDAYRRRRNLIFNVYFAEGWDVERMENAEYDPQFQHARYKKVNPVTSVEENTEYTWAEAKAMVREQHLAWKTKQENMVREYFTTRPSLRIPKGVYISPPQVETELDDDELEDEMYDAMEEQIDNQYVARVDESDLTEEERLDAQMFLNDFAYHDDTWRAAAYAVFQKMERKVRKKQRQTVSYFKLCKQKFTVVTKNFLASVRDIYKRFPKLSMALATISTVLGVGYLIKTIWNLTSTVIPEGAYDSPLSKAPTRTIRVESNEVLSEDERQALLNLESAYGTNLPSGSAPRVRVENAYGVNLPKQSAPKIRVEGATSKVVQEQGCSDANAVMMGRSLLYPLMMTVGWERATGGIAHLQALCICGKMILVPHHFFRSAKNGDFFFFIRNGEKIAVEYSEHRMVRLRDKDACIYYLGAQVDSRKNILKCFASLQDIEKVSTGCPAVLVGTTAEGIMTEKACTVKGNVGMRYKGKEASAPTYYQLGWQYAINTLPGECGSMLIACTNQLPPPAKIIGMHTAGFKDQLGGFSITLTRELIQEGLDVLIERFGAQVIGAPLPREVLCEQAAFERNCKVIPVGDFTYCGVMDSKFSPRQPVKSCIVPTPFQGTEYPVVKKPAQLLVKNGVSPLQKALNKYGKVTRPFTYTDIRIVSNSILIDLMMLKSDLPYEKTSTEVACFGLPGVAYCDPMNFKSSPGWPYQCLTEAKESVGKAYIFDVQNRTIVNELVRANLDERERMAKEGIRVPSIWRDCMKDELRPIEKVEAGKTRLFTIAPVDFTILCRKYFLPFVQAFYKGKSTFFSAVGINAESFDWTRAYLRLSAYGDKCVAGDFGSYDGTIMSDLMAEVGEIIDNWFKLNGEVDDEATMVRRVLVDEMIHTHQLVQNCVYKTHRGNPSGNPLTVIINTIINAFYMRLAWLEIMREVRPHLATMDSYKQNVMEEMYGDDNRLVIKDDVLDVYHQHSITRVLAEHGLEYTDETKSTAAAPWKYLLETTFLKRAYRFDDEVGKEIVLPCIDQDTITSLMNWMRKTLGEEEQLQANMRAALGFAFFHGRGFYDEFYRKFVKQMIEAGFTPLCLTYDELLTMFLNDVHEETDSFSKAVGLQFHVSPLSSVETTAS